MADISKIQMPSGNVYDIKDAVARSLISGGVSFNIAWNGSSTPVVANIPEGVVVTYNDTDYTGTLTAANATSGSFYLVKSNTQKGGSLDVYDEYTVITSGNNKYWEKIGDTQLDLSDLGSLAYKDSVALSKSTDVVLGEATTFTNSSSSVTFTGGTTDKVLGEATTFALSSGTVTVTPTTTNIKATASGTAVGANGTDTFVKSYPGATSKLATTTVPNVTNAGTASTWSFAMGSGDDSETLIISGANGTAPTLGTAKTVATGSLAANGGGDTVMTGLGTATTASALTGVKVTTQPTIALATGATAGTGVISVATGITSASVGTGITVGTNDKVTAVTGIGTGTAAAQTITVGTNDKVTVLKNDTSVTVS
jgi:hypothetical protein